MFSMEFSIPFLLVWKTQTIKNAFICFPIILTPKCCRSTAINASGLAVQLQSGLDDQSDCAAVCVFLFSCFLIFLF